MFMATTTAAPVSVEEYLRSTYEPDVEYVDGQLEERNVGEIEHSDAMAGVMSAFFARDKEWQIRVLPSVRTEVSPTRIRVPDVAICSRSSQDKRIVRQAPLVIIEVLSPEDRISRYQQRIADYHAMGVKAVWVIDPETRRGWDCSSGTDWIEKTEFSSPPLRIDLAAVFQELES
jgi:Uma2 family endonuclease